MVSDEDEQRVVELLRRDVEWTINFRQGDVIVEAARRRRVTGAANDAAQYMTLVVEDVQQHLHDTFVDTTWPACPEHPTHPLWYSDGWWRCGRRLEPVARLGELSQLDDVETFSMDYPDLELGESDWHDGQIRTLEIVPGDATSEVRLVVAIYPEDQHAPHRYELLIRFIGVRELATTLSPEVFTSFTMGHIMFARPNVTREGIDLGIYLTGGYVRIMANTYIVEKR